MVIARKELDTPTWRCTLSQIAAVSVKNIVLLGFGMTVGFPTLLIPRLSGGDNEEKFSLGQEGLSWIGSISLICVPFGCFTSGIITQPLGRRRSMQLINIPFIASWLLYYFSTEIWHIFLALGINGLAGGLMEAPIITYVAEVTQPHLRGILSSTSSMSVIGGVMIQFILGTFLKWRDVALCSLIVPILSFNLIFLIPETPIWLLSKKRYAEAKESLAWLRGWVPVEQVDREYKELFKNMEISRGIGNSAFQAENGSTHVDDNVQVGEDRKNGNIQTRKRTKLETLKLFKKRNFIRPFILVAYVFFLAHFNGMSPIQIYAVSIFTSLRTPLDRYYATALLGVVELFGCVMCVTFVRMVGKRVLCFISLAGTAICFFLAGLYAHIFHMTKILNSADTNISLSNISNSDMQINGSELYSWSPIVLIISGAFFCHMGIRVLPWILTGEIFPSETRAIASGLAATSFYIFGFICNKTFLSLVSLITLPGVFWFYCSMGVIGLIILYFVLPETEGKSLQDITDHFAGKLMLGNNVYKRPKYNSGVDNMAYNNGCYKISKIESRL